MDKEKEIKELYDEILADISVQFGAGDTVEPEDREFCSKQIVEHLQQLGYRKADEVRKETIKECSEWLLGHCHHKEQYLLVGLFNIIFGVEVDE